MKIIVVFNMRGGIGKTTLAVTLAEGLAQFGGAKVLLADADPQRNASLRVCPLAAVDECSQPGSGRNVSKYLSDAMVRNSLPDPASYISERCGTIQGRGRVDILMGAHDTLDADRHFAGRCMTDGDRNIFSKLGRAFQNLSKNSDYDVLIVDSPPGLTTIVQGALGVADLLLVPMLAQSTSELLYGSTQKQIEKHLLASGAAVPPSLVVATMYEASHASFLDRIRVYFKSPLKIKKQKSLALHELFSSEDGETVKGKYGGPAEKELKEVSLAVLNRLGIAANEGRASGKGKGGKVNVGKSGRSGASAAARAH
jgi:cellulose biosynthesis protein BcsQ